MYDIEMYHTEGSNSPIIKFIKNVRKKYGDKELYKIKMLIDSLRKNGIRLNDYHPGALKHISGELYELRPGDFRILFFCYDDYRYVLLHGFRKTTNKTPLHEIQTAKKRMDDYIRRFE